MRKTTIGTDGDANEVVHFRSSYRVVLAPKLRFAALATVATSRSCFGRIPKFEFVRSNFTNDFKPPKVKNVGLTPKFPNQHLICLVIFGRR